MTSPRAPPSRPPSPPSPPARRLAGATVAVPAADRLSKAPDRLPACRRPGPPDRRLADTFAAADGLPRALAQLSDGSPDRRRCADALQPPGRRPGQPLSRLAGALADLPDGLAGALAELATAWPAPSPTCPTAWPAPSPISPTACLGAFADFLHALAGFVERLAGAGADVFDGGAEVLDQLGVAVDRRQDPVDDGGDAVEPDLRQSLRLDALDLDSSLPRWTSTPTVRPTRSRTCAFSATCASRFSSSRWIRSTLTTGTRAGRRGRSSRRRWSRTRGTRARPPCHLPGRSGRSGTSRASGRRSGRCCSRALRPLPPRDRLRLVRAIRLRLVDFDVYDLALFSAIDLGLPAHWLPWPWPP